VDFYEFRQAKLWLKVNFGPEPLPDEPAEYQPPRFEGRVAYAPGTITDQDAAFLARIDRLRLIDFGDDAEAEMAIDREENRAQRRAREKIEKRADAAPPTKIESVTLIDYLKRLVVDWDFVGGREEDGTPIPLPICEESFGMMEPGLRLEIVSAIMVDYLQRPNLTRLSSLFSGTPKTANGPTGPNSSSSPSNGEAGASPGTLQAAPRLAAVPSGGSG
jgi:hypothetical protein